ncbi:MAG: restriction endonuclease [Gammaproteobacteria bacterium]
MATIRALDMMLIDDLFEMGGGYVLNFSDRTFAQFFAQELDIDIDDPRYSRNGTSKAKRLRCFLHTVEESSVLRTLKALWEYREAIRERFGKQERVPSAQEKFARLLERLQGTRSPETEHKTAPKPTSASGLPSRSTVSSLLSELMALPAMAPHPRGYAFEKFLKRLFDGYGLEARDAFKLTGEQIDGSFQLSNDTYLLEAKWQGSPCGVADLHAFHGKVEQKAAWTRGLFISNSGFSPDGLAAFGRGKRVVCVDGFDLYEVLSRDLSLPQVLDRKVRHAAETGVLFARVRDLFPEQTRASLR